MSGEDNLPAADAIELRVLHGPQAGARLPLQAGQSYTIGAADTCTVVLIGAQVAQEHARISADESGIIVEPLEGRVLDLAGQDVEREALALGSVLQLGFVKLTAARTADEWPADEVLQVRSPPIEAADEVKEEPEDDRAAPLPGQPEPAPPAAVPAPRRAGFRRYAAYGAVALLVGAAALAAVQGSGEADPTSPSAAHNEAGTLVDTHPVEQDPGVALADALKSFPMGALALKRNDGGGWVVEGRLRTEAELKTLRERVSPLKQPVEFKVMLDAERLAAVKRFAEAQRVAGRLELRVEPGAGDALRIVGSASSAEEALAFPEAARRELAGFEPIEFDILQPQQVRAIFMDRLRDAGLGGKFKVIATEPALDMRGVLGPQETRAWESLFMDFTRRYGSTLKISAHVEPERDALVSQVAAVVGGAFPYIVTTQGQRIAPGGTLGGSTVVSVRDGEIAFSDGTRVRYGP